MAVLVAVAVAASALARLRVEKDVVLAAARAVLQLGLVALVLTAVLGSVLWSLLFAVVMLVVAVATSARRIGAARAWPWVAVAIAAGALPTLLVIFASGSVPFEGTSLVPFAGIIIGGAMTASSLTGRRCFAALREERPAYEAALSLGLPRAEAISEVVRPRLAEALVPGLDQTRTVGLVTLPGAFVGVLLGGGSPVQAGAAQLVVLVGLLAAQTVVVVTAHALMRSGRLLPTDLREGLQP
ncbi:ABC transporter permease [Auraticoccus sp. F435]|uniref:ABC transporter permease n=1 Tax=Auraticoccus cholistanensis TaxID=2656650 RepID=A0A6A9UTU8_9ACTN|nr:ABC transporter permease [Auraticoccus cholistanensis]MVA75165.1 ABC transporter permease [Auraticoccus cholistanensis]